MKNSNLLKLSLLAISSLALASCGLSGLTSNADNATSAAASAASSLTGNDAAQANLSPADQQLVNNINAGLLSNETLAKYLKSPTVNKYVKNAISLVLAKKYISEGNVALANKYLTYFNLANATTSQTGIFQSLKNLIGK